MRSLLGQCHFPTVLCLQAVNLLRIVIVYVVSIVVSVCFHHHHLITSNFGGNFSKALSRGCSSARGVCLCRRHTYMGIIERYTVVAQNSDETSCLKMTQKKVPFIWENAYALCTCARIGATGCSNNFWPKFLNSVRLINPGTFT